MCWTGLLVSMLSDLRTTSIPCWTPVDRRQVGDALCHAKPLESQIANRRIMRRSVKRISLTQTTYHKRIMEKSSGIPIISNHVETDWYGTGAAAPSVHSWVIAMNFDTNLQRALLLCLGPLQITQYYCEPIAKHIVLSMINYTGIKDYERHCKRDLRSRKPALPSPADCASFPPRNPRAIDG